MGDMDDIRDCRNIGELRNIVEFINIGGFINMAEFINMNSDYIFYYLSLLFSNPLHALYVFLSTISSHLCSNSLLLLLPLFYPGVSLFMLSSNIALIF